MVATMTVRQRQRRDDVIRAVLDLAAEHGVDGIQMRDVCDRSGVALATVYRYFTSKDHLVAEALMAGAARLHDHLDLVAAELGPAERLVAVLRRALAHVERQPHLAGMLLHVSRSPDPQASEAYRRLGTVIRDGLGRTIPDVDPVLREDVLQVIGAVWYHAIVEWMAGRIPVHEVHARLGRASGLLLAEHRSEVLR